MAAKIPVENVSWNTELYHSWNAILSQAENANFQLVYEWSSSWWEVFGSDKKLMLLTVRDANNILAIAPLMIINPTRGRTGLNPRICTFIGDGLTDYHDFLTVKERRKEAIESIIEYLLKYKDSWDLIHLRNIPAVSPNLEALRTLIKSAELPYIFRVNIQCPYIQIDSCWDDYYRRLSNKFRQGLRRRERILGEIGDVEYESMKDNDVEQVMDVARSIHVKRQQSLKRKSWFNDVHRYKFASLILDRFLKREWLHVSFLKVRGRIISYRLGFAFNQVAYAWNTSFDPEFMNFGAGQLMYRHWIHDCFEREYREVNFMVGSEPHKLRWTNLMRPNYEIFVFNNNIRSRLLKHYYNIKPVLNRYPALQKTAAAINNWMARKHQHSAE